MQKARYVAALGIPLVALLSFTLAAAWTDPTEAPPNGNVAAPINVGSIAQVKNGGLGVNTLTVFGNSLFGGSTGSNAYMNFGATSGYNGYGIRDNAGTLEFKNLSGSWASLQSTIFTLCSSGACGGGGASATTGTACSPEGALGYDSSAHAPVYCNGTIWMPIGGTQNGPPIGSIVAWDKNLTGTPALPSGWVQCDGQTLNDADSPLNGQVIPNLNGTAKFLRGSSVSGTMQNATIIGDMMTQSGIQPTIYNYDNSGSTYNAWFATMFGTVGTQYYKAVRPTNMSVVWIMRVK